MNKKIYQDNFYSKIEANAYFKRVLNNNHSLKNIQKNFIRSYKLKIYNLINKTFYVNKNTKILEVGCFIGDLLNLFKKKNNCKIYGIEPSKKACNFSKKNFNIKIENKTFYKSKLYKIEKKISAQFDIIIFDDVLSWIDRKIILSTIAVTDSLLSDKGIIFIRDFCPSKMFAHPNHHYKNKKIYNFKNKNGHKEFFINSGKYKILYHKKYFTSKMQKVKIKNRQSMIWSDTILKKVEGFTHPIVKIK